MFIISAKQMLLGSFYSDEMEAKDEDRPIIIKPVALRPFAQIKSFPEFRSDAVHNHPEEPTKPKIMRVASPTKSLSIEDFLSPDEDSASTVFGNHYFPYESTENMGNVNVQHPDTGDIDQVNVFWQQIVQSENLKIQNSVNTVDQVSHADGYNWRKYGQKQVKGSEFPRSYYKCTHPRCPVKKKTERLMNGRIEGIIYRGEHNHPKLHASTADERQSANSAYEVNALTDPSDSKSMSTGMSQTVIQASADSNVNGDGYQWRKYGQKVVKGNPYPRSYFKCSAPNCNVRKHVERAWNDPSSVIITYEGKHDHEMAASNPNPISDTSEQESPLAKKLRQ